MSHLALLFNLQKRILANTYWRTPRQRFITILLLGGAIAFLVGGAYAAQRFLLAGVIAVVGGGIMFGLVMFWIFFSALTESLANLVPRFYRSPDLNYLLALPLPPNRVLAIKFLAAQLQSIRGVSFLTLVLLVAVGWALGAPWYYYLLLFPVFLLFGLIPAGLGLLLGMAALRLMTAETFVRLAGILSFVVGGGFWVVLLQADEEYLLLLLFRILEFFAGLGAWVELIPLVSATTFFNAIATGELVQAGRPLLMLLLVTGVTMAGIFRLARHLFYRGWLITQSAPSDAVGAPRKRPIGKRQASAHAPWYALVVSEWRLAVRNGEMRFVFFGMLVMFVTLIVVLAKGIILEGDPAAAMAVLTIAAAILVPFSIVPLFLPPEIQSASSVSSAATIMKGRLWLLKSLPLHAREVVLAIGFKVVGPAFLLGAVGILVYAIISGSGFILAIAALAGCLMLLCGQAALHTGLEFWEYAGNVHSLIANTVQLLLPIGYLLAAAGPLTLYLLSDIPLLALFRIESLFVIGLIAWPLFSFLAIGGGFRLAVRNWEEMEI